MDSFELLEDKLKKMLDEHIITKSWLGTIYKPTGKKLKRFRFYVDPNFASTLKGHINNRQFTDIHKIKKCSSSNYLIDIRITEDGNICLFQLMEYIPYSFVPASPVVELHDADAKIILTWSKS
ncbi:MAG: hypothetical protein LBK03_03440 [Bacteroidales bacterium]|jgi:hypothetical protein|nr:hypothetical protein [Bacteroidales bacterium]